MMKGSKVHKLSLFDTPSEERLTVNLYNDTSRYFLSKKEVIKLLELGTINFLTVVTPDKREVPVIFNSYHLQYYPKEPNQEKALRHLDLIPVSSDQVTVEIPIIYRNRHLIKVGIHKELLNSITLKVSNPLQTLTQLSCLEVDLLHHLGEKRIITVGDVTHNLSELCTAILPKDTVVYKLNLSSKERKALHQK